MDLLTSKAMSSIQPIFPNIIPGLIISLFFSFSSYFFFFFFFFCKIYSFVSFWLKVAKNLVVNCYKTLCSYVIMDLTHYVGEIGSFLYTIIKNVALFRCDTTYQKWLLWGGVKYLLLKMCRTGIYIYT